MTDGTHIDPDDEDVPELTVGRLLDENRLVTLAREAGWPVTDETELPFDDARGDHVMVVATENGSARLARLYTDDAFVVVRYINLACYVHEDLPDPLRMANLPYANFLRLTKEHKLDANV